MLKINQTLVNKKKKVDRGKQMQKMWRTCPTHSLCLSAAGVLLRVFSAVSLQKLPVFFHVKLLQMLSDTGRVVRLSVLGVFCF